MTILWTPGMEWGHNNNTIDSWNGMGTLSLGQCYTLHWNGRNDIIHETMQPPSIELDVGRQRLTLNFVPLVPLPGESKLVGSYWTSVPCYIVTHTL